MPVGLSCFLERIHSITSSIESAPHNSSARGCVKYSETEEIKYILANFIYVITSTKVYDTKWILVWRKNSPTTNLALPLRRTSTIRAGFNYLTFSTYYNWIIEGEFKSLTVLTLRRDIWEEPNNAILGERSVLVGLVIVFINVLQILTPFQERHTVVHLKSLLVVLSIVDRN